MLIEERIPKTAIETSGYYRQTGDAGLTYLIQQIQSGVIANGNELEHLIYENCKLSKFHNVISTEHSFEKSNYLVSQYKIPKGLCGNRGINIDFVLVDKNKILLLEMKDGDNFDTKKSSGEIDKGFKAVKYVRENNPGKDVQYKMVLWNNVDLSKSSVKDPRAKQLLMTGKEFAKLARVSTSAINSKRKEEQAKNAKYIYDQVAGLLKRRKHETIF